MIRILVTGGTGVLGRELVQQLQATSATLRLMSRGQRPAQLPPQIEWAQADLASGAGLAEAVHHVDVLLHAASSPLKQTKHVDVRGTAALLAAARAANVGHCIYVSIVGVDQIPYAYYRAKLAAEGLVRNSGVPWTLQRISQFHPLVEGLMRFVNRGPLLVLPTDFQFQPIAPADAAVRLVELTGQPAQGRTADIGGPEVLTLGELARQWLATQGLRRRVVHLPLPGSLAHSFRQGNSTCPEQRYGTLRWSDWLRQTTAAYQPVASAYER
ncbi:MAG: NAD(P)H-binding protein [Chloroflexaceae bacterium]|jgi:uncharacterized protein YbjT (DUF2867 family)|nr:NAD(P)H-binding protein [Chloroflexaceae bacterium]